MARWRPTDLVEVARQRTAADFAAAVADWRDQWTVPRYVYAELRRPAAAARPGVPASARCLPFRTAARAGPALDRRRGSCARTRRRLAERPRRAFCERDRGAPGAAATSTRRRHSPHRSPSPGYLRSGRASCIRPGPTGSTPSCTARHTARTTCFSTRPPLLPMLLAAGSIDNWFFVRYADPDRHLRIRMHGRQSTLQSVVSPQLNSWARHLVERDLCQRFCLDTYEPEVERYGGVAGVELSERIFGADSRAVTELLDLVRSGRSTTETVALAAWTTVRSAVVARLRPGRPTQSAAFGGPASGRVRRRSAADPCGPWAADLSRHVRSERRAAGGCRAARATPRPRGTGGRPRCPSGGSAVSATTGSCEVMPTCTRTAFGLDRRAEAQMLRVLVKTLYGLSVTR